jgi:phosphatidylserine/phosphatidylglycerophosphate/cardiolipin synthase-like enzyme
MTLRAMQSLSLGLLLLWAGAAPAFQATYGPITLPAVGSLQVAFTPGDDVGAMISRAISRARREIYVQAFSFTHRDIANALVSARKRGVKVEVVADAEQAFKIRTSLIHHLVSRGVPVFLDGEHASAHNKVMIIDPGTPQAVLLTGSYNFTHAAQYKNAENMLTFTGNPALTQLFLENWRRHRTHARPYRP